MKITNFLKFNKIKKFLEKSPLALGKKAFLTSICLIILSLVLGSFVFYKYSFLVQKSEPEIIKKPLQFKEDLYQKILENLQDRKNKFEETELKEYPNPFQG